MMLLTIDGDKAVLKITYDVVGRTFTLTEFKVDGAASSDEGKSIPADSAGALVLDLAWNADASSGIAKLSFVFASPPGAPTSSSVIGPAAQNCTTITPDPVTPHVFTTKFDTTKVTSDPTHPNSQVECDFVLGVSGSSSPAKVILLPRKGGNPSPPDDVKPKPKPGQPSDRARGRLKR